MEVLTEVLLSLLTRPSSLFRHVVDQVFTILAPHLTVNALNMILEVSAVFSFRNEVSIVVTVVVQFDSRFDQVTLHLTLTGPVFRER